MSLAGKRTKDGTNYCHKNIVRAVRLAPRQPKRNYIDTKKGDAHPLSTSGLEPHFILSKKYGKLPNYLRERQQEEEAAKKELQTEINLYKPEGRYITQPERKALLAGLKHNWEEVQKAYQLLPILTDTLPKKKHKAKLEEELKQLEHDIRMLERHPHIYVTDASCSVFSYDPDSD
ncbi:enkurin [Periplaneta americana]|uniref:enkurin n=1 Tax=Periplaneta americana TaxID=6978 RepID=UPI0037E86BCD